MGLWNVLASLGGSAAISLVAARWLLKRAEKEIDRRLDEKQSQRLESLRQEHKRELQSLEVMEARLTAQFAAVAALHGAAHSASLPRRVDALDQLWKAIVRLDKGFPAGLALLDVVTENEYASARMSAKTSGVLANLTYESIYTDYLSPVDADHLRPFVSETLWQLFFAYRAFLGRVYVTGINSKTRLIPWYKDGTTCQLLKSILPPEEYERIMALPLGKLYSARSAVETCILQEMRGVLSGDKMSVDALGRVREIQDAITRAEEVPALEH